MTTIVIPDDDPPYYDSAEHPQLRRLEAYGEVVCHGTRFADREEFFHRIAPAALRASPYRPYF